MNESDEQIAEAWNRWVDLIPLSDPELDALLCWATQEAGERTARNNGERRATRRRGGNRLSEWERTAIRLLLAGRVGNGRKLVSPPDGLINQRWREVKEGKDVQTGNTQTGERTHLSGRAER